MFELNMRKLCLGALVTTSLFVTPGGTAAAAAAIAATRAAGVRGSEGLGSPVDTGLGPESIQLYEVKDKDSRRLHEEREAPQLDEKTNCRHSWIVCEHVHDREDKLYRNGLHANPDWTSTEKFRWREIIALCHNMNDPLKPGEDFEIEEGLKQYFNLGNGKVPIKPYDEIGSPGFHLARETLLKAYKNVGRSDLRLCEKNEAPENLCEELNEELELASGATKADLNPIIPAIIVAFLGSTIFL